MSPLADYVVNHTLRSACTCGKCIDAGDPNVFLLPHTVNMYFFNVCAVNNPDAAEFKKLVAEHTGSFCDCNPFDGKEHSYMELGGWIGDQGLAMQFMALGELLDCWKVMQPGMIFDVNDPKMKGIADQMAGMGMVSILPKS